MSKSVKTNPESLLLPAKLGNQKENNRTIHNLTVPCDCSSDGIDGGSVVVQFESMVPNGG